MQIILLASQNTLLLDLELMRSLSILFKYRGAFGKKYFGVFEITLLELFEIISFGVFGNKYF